MRLLEKTQINTLKAQDRRKEIDEGAKLAKKVDALREALSTEQVSLLKFRTETVKQVQKEIDEFIIERDDIKKEIEKLKLQRQELIDVEWNKIYSKQDELIKYGESLNERYLELQGMEQHYKLKLEDLELEEERITESKKETIRSLAKAEKNWEKARQMLIKVTKAEEESNNEILRKEKLLDKREKELNSKEFDITHKYEQLKK